MPEILRAYEAHRDQGFTVLAVNTTFQDNETDVRAFVREFGLTFPVVLDPTGSMSRRYQLRALPTTFFVDRRGAIQEVVVGGPMSRALIESKVAKILAP